MSRFFFHPSPNPASAALSKSLFKPLSIYRCKPMGALPGKISMSAFPSSTLVRSLAMAALLATGLAQAADGVSPNGIAVAQMRAQPSAAYQYRVGDFQITALSDGTVPQDLFKLLTGTNESEVGKLLHSSFLQNPVEASINAYLINTGSKLILVDTGSGEFFSPGYGGKVLSGLKAAGYDPEQIDDILITHIHTDHTGGLVSNGKLVFPNAQIHVGKADVDFFMNPANQRRSGYDMKYFTEAKAAVGPYVAAGKVKPFQGRTEILPGITAIPTPGHTPGHSFYLLESKGQQLELWGDIAHVVSVQFPKPGITIVYDVDPKLAAVQRAEQLKKATADRRTVAGAHFPYPGIGHIRQDGDGYRWVPVDYRDRTGK